MRMTPRAVLTEGANVVGSQGSRFAGSVIEPTKGGHPQHRWPEPRATRGFQARKRARRFSEPLYMVAEHGTEPASVYETL